MQPIRPKTSLSPSAAQARRSAPVRASTSRRGQVEPRRGHVPQRLLTRTTAQRSCWSGVRSRSAAMAASAMAAPRSSALSRSGHEPPVLALVVGRVVPAQHLAGVEGGPRVGLALEGELGPVDLLHPAFLEREGMRVEDRATMLLVVGDDLQQPLVGGVAHGLGRSRRPPRGSGRTRGGISTSSPIGPCARPTFPRWSGAERRLQVGDGAVVLTACSVVWFQVYSKSGITGAATSSVKPSSITRPGPLRNSSEGLAGMLGHHDDDHAPRLGPPARGTASRRDQGPRSPRPAS